VEEGRVERLVEDFKRLRPDIDPQTKAVGARLLHLSDLVQRYYGAVCECFDVSLAGLGVLTALARSAPRELTLKELNRDILVTSGGITFVVVRLESRGLVIKRLHPSDGRAVLVQLTRRGRKVADQLIDAVALADEAALADLSVSDLPTADKLLTRLQAGIESAMSIQQEMRSGTEAPGRSSGVSRQ
jgi:DNA-binding MarR family transcriptional regulator